MREKLDEPPCNTIIEITAQTSLPAGIAGSYALNIRKPRDICVVIEEMFTSWREGGGQLENKVNPRCKRPS